MGQITVYINAGGKPALVNITQDPDSGFCVINEQRLATASEISSYSGDVAAPVPVNP